MRIGDTIQSIGQPLLPGMTSGYNGTDFDPIRSVADNADGVAVITGGQSGAALRVFAEGAAFNGTTFDRIRSAADNLDGIATVGLGLGRSLAIPGLFNGTTFDRARPNLDNITLVTLTAASASGQSPDQTNFNGRGAKIFINVTAITGTSPVLVVNVQIKDPVSGVYSTVLTSLNITATGVTVLTVYPGIAATASVSLSDILSRTWRVSYTISGTTPAVTATIAAIIIV